MSKSNNKWFKFKVIYTIVILIVLIVMVGKNNSVGKWKEYLRIEKLESQLIDYDVVGAYDIKSCKLEDKYDAEVYVAIIVLDDGSEQTVEMCDTGENYNLFTDGVANTYQVVRDKKGDYEYYMTITDDSYTQLEDDFAQNHPSDFTKRISPKN